MNKLYIFCPKYLVDVLTEDRLLKLMNNRVFKHESKYLVYDFLVGKNYNKFALLKALEKDKEDNNCVVFAKCKTSKDEPDFMKIHFSYNKMNKKIKYLRDKLNIVDSDISIDDNENMSNIVDKKERLIYSFSLISDIRFRFYVIKGNGSGHKHIMLSSKHVMDFHANQRRQEIKLLDRV